MAIQFQCDNCGKSLKTDESKAGRKVKCPGCANVLTIPNPEDTFDDSWKELPQEDEDNPYRAPRSLEDTARRYDDELDSHSLPSPWRRLVGSILDGLCGIGFILPGVVLLVAGGPFNEQQQEGIPVLGLAGIALAIVGALSLLGLNLYLLATRSQSLAKYILGMQIRDYATKQPASFMKCFVLRMFVNGLIGGIPFVGGIYTIADGLFVFSAEHRCLHDQLAGTYVVNLS